MNAQTIGLLLTVFFVFVVTPYRYYRRSLRESHSSSAIFPSVKIAIGASSDVGPRPTNEDCHVVHSNGYLLTGLFDGHCGREASCAAAQLFPREFRRFPSSFEIFEGFFEINDGIKAETSHGTTACCVFINDRQIAVANCGDSRAVICHAGEAIELSSDFKPERPSERARITTEGGKVREVNVGVTRMFPGGLSVSRSLGDRSIPLVSGVPEIYSGLLCEEDEFYVSACDGVFDVMSSQDVIEVVRECRKDAQIRGIEQALSLENVDDTLFNNVGEVLLNFYGKARMKLLREFDDFSPGDMLLKHADALAAKIISRKVVEAALMRNTNDNVTCIVGLFRWPSTPKTVGEWKEWHKSQRTREGDVVERQQFEITHSASDESTEFWGLDSK